eukprot:1141927-Prorocentrum_minimum.AAC.1
MSFSQGRLRPKNVASVRAHNDVKSYGRADYGVRGHANPTASAVRGTHATNGAHKKLSKSEQEALEFKALTQQLVDTNLPHAKRMVVIQQLNETFLQAQSLEKVAFDFSPKVLVVFRDSRGVIDDVTTLGY